MKLSVLLPLDVRDKHNSLVLDWAQQGLSRN